MFSVAVKASVTNGNSFPMHVKHIAGNYVIEKSYNEYKTLDKMIRHRAVFWDNELPPLPLNFNFVNSLSHSRRLEKADALNEWLQVLVMNDAALQISAVRSFFASSVGDPCS
jgi:hypothetical protein